MITWSYGGGWQSAGIAAMIVKELLPLPDLIVFSDTGREVQSTFEYLGSVVQPALQKLGRQVEVICKDDFATVDLWRNDDLLLPMFTGLGRGKLPTFCSNEWKQRPIKRWLRNQDVQQCDVWIGFSIDEKSRRDRAANDNGWYQRTFPLYDLHLTRADCMTIIKDFGWPEPPSSACWMCPNMNDSEWHEMKRDYPADFKKAITLEMETQEWDGDLYLHRSLQPLAEVEFDPNGHSRKESRYQCSFGCML